LFSALTSAPPKTRQKAALGSATARAENNRIPQLIRRNSFFIVDVTSSIRNLPEGILAILQPMTKTQLQGVGQNKLPKWANPACQSQTGFHIARGGAQEYYNVIPDVATFAKCISNGFALGAVAGKRELMEVAVDRSMFLIATCELSPE
jgi:hypothetical protein